MTTLVMDFAGQVGVVPRFGRLNAPDNTITEVTTAGFLSPALGTGVALNTSDVILCHCSNGIAMCSVSISGSGQIDLTNLL